MVREVCAEGDQVGPMLTLFDEEAARSCFPYLALPVPETPWLPWVARYGLLEDPGEYRKKEVERI